MAVTPSDPEVQRAKSRYGIRVRFYGRDDPRTVEAARAFIQAKIAQAERETDRLRAELAALDGTAA